MRQTKERYLVDEDGNRVSVVIAIGEYAKIVEDLEDLAEIRAFDLAKASGDEVIPFEQAVAEIERDRD